LLKHLERWSVGWTPGEPVSLLDLGTGSADLPLEAVRWAHIRGIDLRITALDSHATTLELARDHIGREPELAGAITLIHADALHYVAQTPPGSFDYVHAGMFLHHFREIEVMTLLAGMDRLARRGLIWNDLVRSSVGRAAIQLMTIGQAEIVRHDARVSVEAGFTRAEVTDLAGRLSLGYCAYEWSLVTLRFTLAGEKPWSTGPSGA
jgi:ubiquinone/menaquinone biosynthesis C-methylase UbiE